MKRWYDKHPELAQYLERFRTMEVKRRDTLVKGIVALARKSAPSIFEDFLLDFPLDLHRRRWYDRDPYLWLMFNGLAYAKEDVVGAVTRYLRENMES